MLVHWRRLADDCQGVAELARGTGGLNDWQYLAERKFVVVVERKHIRDTGEDSYRHGASRHCPTQMQSMHL